ncbi:glycosyltransferase family 4 protein [bacterium]|nr:glycosyltransferase family 4 protein [bacterium]
MDVTIVLAITVICSIALFVYFKVAEKIKLVDYPNERSSHSRPTYRGAGIVFISAYLAGLFFYGQYAWTLSLGLLLAAVVGFMDDYKGLSASLRALLYLISLILCLYSIPQIFNLPIYIILMTVVLGLGTVNAYNFMDGINGITTLYSMVLFGTIAWYFSAISDAFNPNYIIPVLIATFVFAFINVRKKALAFMGDTGSVMLGMFAVFLVVLTIWKTQQAAWLLLLLVYGVDSVLTIVERLLRKENIFNAHRRHLYQLLVNEYRKPHVTVSIIYAITQLVINICLYYSIDSGWGTWKILLIFALVTALIYISVKMILLRGLSRK